MSLPHIVLESLNFSLLMEEFLPDLRDVYITSDPVYSCMYRNNDIDSSVVVVMIGIYVIYEKMCHQLMFLLFLVLD